MHCQTKLEMSGGRYEPQRQDRREKGRSDTEASGGGQESRSDAQASCSRQESRGNPQTPSCGSKGCEDPQTPSCSQESSSDPRQEEARSCRSAGDDSSSAARSRHYRRTASTEPCSRVRASHPTWAHPKKCCPSCKSKPVSSTKSSSTESDRILALSFWQTEEDAERYNHEQFPKVNELVQSLLETTPKVQTFNVDTSTTHKIAKGKAA
jgi:hypothetical protein